MAIDTIKSSAVLDGAIATADIADDAVTTAKIPDDAITTAKILNENITSGKLASGAAIANVGTGAITNAKIANSTLDLTAKVTGALPVANGGTALTSGFLNGGITFGAATSVAGSNSTTFTGIPSTARMIRVLWMALTPGSQYHEWRLGNSSAMITAGYFNHMHYGNHSNTGYTDYSNNANSFRMPGWTAANNTWYGWFDFIKQPHTNGNTYWHQTSNIWNSGYTTYGGFDVRGFVNATTTTVDRYQIIGASGANLTEGNIQVGYI